MLIIQQRCRGVTVNSLIGSEKKLINQVKQYFGLIVSKVIQLLTVSISRPQGEEELVSLAKTFQLTSINKYISIYRGAKFESFEPLWPRYIGLCEDSGHLHRYDS